MTESDHERPAARTLPAPTTHSTAFWSGGAKGQLLIQRCDDCERLLHPPAAACHRCRSTRVAPALVSGAAVVTAFTVNRHTWFENFPPPYVIAIVELKEDPSVRLTTNIVGCSPDEVAVGMPVSVAFEHWDDVWIPVFEPTADSRATS